MIFNITYVIGVLRSEHTPQKQYKCIINMKKYEQCLVNRIISEHFLIMYEIYVYYLHIARYLL